MQAEYYDILSRSVKYGIVIRIVQEEIVHPSGHINTLSINYFNKIHK